VSEEVPQTIRLEVLKIRDRAQAVLGAVTGVEAGQAFTREAGATAAEDPAAAAPHRAGLDAAEGPGFRLAAIVAPATRAGIALAQEGDAKAAVHAAGGDQAGRIKRFGLGFRGHGLA
jgi:hypothetical protein